jgi:hypothetical protein
VPGRWPRGRDQTGGANPERRKRVMVTDGGPREGQGAEDAVLDETVDRRAASAAPIDRCVSQPRPVNEPPPSATISCPVTYSDSMLARKQYR